MLIKVVNSSIKRSAKRFWLALVLGPNNHLRLEDLIQRINVRILL
jgi:hypothetical protein